MMKPTPMKYEIRLHKTEIKTVEVFADDHSKALKLAKESNPGFTSDTVVEVLGEDEIGEEHTREGSCENCDKEFWDEDEFTMTDDGSFCPHCVEAMQGA